jgi:hypothetical protein
MRPRHERAEYKLLLAALRRGEQHSFHSAATLLGLDPRNARPYIALAREAEGVYVARWSRDRQGPPYPVLAWSMDEREDAIRPNSAERQRANRRRREMAKRSFGRLVATMVGVAA